ncbi:Regulator of chromosome condensation (RCC1) repeat protein [compost metagenome]
MKKKTKDSPKDSQKKAWKRRFAGVAALLLLWPGLIVSGTTQVEGAGYQELQSVTTASFFRDGSDTYSLAATNYVVDLHTTGGLYRIKGTNMAMVDPSSSNPYVDNGGTVTAYANGETPIGTGGVYLGTDGYLYKSKADPTHLFELQFKQVVTDQVSKSYFGLGKDGIVYAWGTGSNGELGIGSKSDKSVPTEVLAPSGTDPISGIKKIIPASESGVILLTDNQAYLVGKFLSYSSLSSARPLLLTSFPTFSSSSQVTVGYLGGTQESHYKSGSTIDATFRRFYLTVGTTSYVVTPLSSTVTTGNDYGTTLTAFPTGIDPAKISLFPTTDAYLFSGAYLDNGQLYAWGYGSDKWNNGTSLPDIANKKLIDSGVSKITTDTISRTSFYLKNNKLYAFGWNNGSITGTTDSSISSPIPVTGPNSELTNVKDVAISRSTEKYKVSIYSEDSLPQVLAITGTGDLYGWHTTGALTKAAHPQGRKFVSFIEIPGSFNIKPVYVMDDAGGVYKITTSNYLANDYISLVGVSGLPSIVPAGYVALPDKPTATQSVDKFNQTVITLAFSTPDPAVKEYSLDGGITWTNYTEPVTITQAGAYSFSARAGDNDGNFSDVLSLTGANDPIIINPGFPKIVDGGDGTVSVQSGTTSSNATVQIRIDGGAWETYADPVTLGEGSHTVSVQIINSSGEVLATSSQTVEGPTPTPTSTATPTPTSTATSSVTPSATPTTTPSEAPSATPTPTPVATASPSAVPSASAIPSPEPTVDPSWGDSLGSKDVSFTVLSGSFSSQFNGLLLDNVTISTTNPYQQINSVTNSVIEDSRGSGAGWNYSLKITDFVSDPVIDNGTGNTDLVVKMPASALGVDVTDASVLAGQTSAIAKKGNYTFASDPVVLAQAGAYEGMGQYQLPMSYTLRVPDKVEVVSAGTGSSYQVGKMTGLRVGTYRSQFTFTLASGI